MNIEEIKRTKKKKLVQNPIKKINFDGGNAKEIVRMIAKALGFKIHEDAIGLSAYGGNAIRIADHCTYMQTWVDNGTWNAPVRFDIVIEDEPTEPKTQVSGGHDFTITEIVHNSDSIDPQKARMIAFDIKNAINCNQYANNVRGIKRTLTSTHGEENNQENINCNRIMNKNRIRLTESQLHRVIKESVKRVLKEWDWDDDSEHEAKKWPEDNYYGGGLPDSFYANNDEDMYDPEYDFRIKEWANIKSRLNSILDEMIELSGDSYTYFSECCHVGYAIEDIDAYFKYFQNRHIEGASKEYEQRTVKEPQSWYL